MKTRERSSGCREALYPCSFRQGARPNLSRRTGLGRRKELPIADVSYLNSDLIDRERGVLYSRLSIGPEGDFIIEEEGMP